MAPAVGLLVPAVSKHRNKKPLCKATKANGHPCQAPARADGLCMAHSPEVADKWQAGAAKGGHNSKVLVRLQKTLTPEMEIFGRLEAVFLACESGKMSPQRAVALAAVAKTMLAAIDQGAASLAVEAPLPQIQVVRDYRQAISPLQPPPAEADLIIDGEVLDSA